MEALWVIIYCIDIGNIRRCRGEGDPYPRSGLAIYHRSGSCDIGGEAHHHHVGLVFGRYVTSCCSQVFATVGQVVAYNRGRGVNGVRVNLQFLRRFYGLLLNLYPEKYQAEYGEELHVVFNLALDDAMKTGKMEVTLVAMHELLSLPRAIMHEHLRERRKEKMAEKSSSRFNFAPGSIREFFSALFPFFLLGFILPLLNIFTRSGWLTPRGVLVNGIAIVVLVFMGILFLIGLFTGLPRWFLPYMGFLLSLFSVYGFSQLLNRWWIISFQSFYDRSWFLGQVAYQGHLWVGLSVVALLLVLAIRLVPSLRRFKNNWTLLPFLLYGSSPFALAFTFDDYVNEEPYELFAFLVLATGLWLYLRTDDPRRKFWALFGGLSVSLFAAAIAKAILFSSSAWPYPRFSFSWQNEMMSTIIMWGWIAVSMLIPMLIKLFPRLESSSSAK